MNVPPAGWYADPEDAAQLRYWDGSSWTQSRASRQQEVVQPPVQPAAPVVPVRLVTPNVYGEHMDLAHLLTPEQSEQCKQHTLTRFPTWLVVVLHYLTFGIFTTVYQGLKLSRLPLVTERDFSAGKGIGFLFIPFYNYYWVFRFVLAITDRLNFQFRLRGQRPPVSRGLALASCIVLVIPYVGLITWLILMPIVAGQWQVATNRLVDEREG